MEDPRPEKVAVVTEVKERLGRADAAVLTEYRGLNVAAMAELRRALRAAGGEYKIYKNTLARFACAQPSGIDTLDEMLDGPDRDRVRRRRRRRGGQGAARLRPRQPGARRQGRPARRQACSTADEVTALADLPSREVLLASSPVPCRRRSQQFAGLLAALPRNFAYGLKALIDQQGGVLPRSRSTGLASHRPRPKPSRRRAEAPAPKQHRARRRDEPAAEAPD